MTTERRLLAAVFDRIIPADDFPAVSGAGLFEHLDTLRGAESTSAVTDRVDLILERLDAAARAAHGTAIVDLDPVDVDRLIEELAWADRELLVRLAAEAYYGHPDGAGARMVGFDRSPKRGPAAPIVEPVLRTAPLGEIDHGYDVVVLGAGAGGGVAARVLAEAGTRVLVVDRGAVLRYGEVGRDHLRNHRAAVYGVNTSGPRERRELVDVDGRVTVVEDAHDPRWHDDAMVVGGGTRVYQGMAWRFHPLDFAMASTYGAPPGSSLADWPITYDDLEPHYAWAEQVIGVAGDADAHPTQGSRTGPYPLPPFPPSTEVRALQVGAEALGLRTGPVPLLINTEPRDGRARCVRCGECVGFACPSDAKNSSHNALLPRALETGDATLVERCRATSLLVDANGRVTGVHLVDERTGAGVDVHAGHVVVACGAIETARLLLASRSSHHPSGIGNGHDQVGRHLQGHSFVSAFGLHDDGVVDMEGPGVGIATLDHLHGNPGVVGGGVIANEMIKLPIVHWRWSHHPAAPRWGLAGKTAMRDSYRRTGHLFCQVQEVPVPGNRVTLGEGADRVGMPIVRLQGSAHPETLRTATHVQSVAARWMEASGAREVWVDQVPAGLSAGQHQAGTCRMGTDPRTSVTDPEGRVHGHDNLWVADGSLHVTNGGVNPVLTIYALAHRTAEILAGA